MSVGQKTFLFCRKPGLVVIPQTDNRGCLVDMKPVAVSHIQSLDEMSAEYQKYQQSIDSGTAIMIENNVAIMEKGAPMLNSETFFSMSEYDFVHYISSCAGVFIPDEQTTGEFTISDTDKGPKDTADNKAMGSVLSGILGAAKVMGGD